MKNSFCVVLCYILVYSVIHAFPVLSVSNTTGANDFGSCLYDPDRNQWMGVEGEEFNVEITSLVECVAYCKRVTDHDVGFYDDATTTCFCGDEEACTDCENIDCGDEATSNPNPLTSPPPYTPACEPPFQNGDEVCDWEYIPNAFYVSSALELGGFEPFSTNSTATMSVSEDEDTPYQFTYDFGDGSDVYVTAGSGVSHQFFMPGDHEVAISSSAFSSQLRVPVRVLDPPAGSTVS